MRSHGFRFRGQYEQEIKQELELGGVEITAGIPGENAKAQDSAKTRRQHHGSGDQDPRRRRRPTTRRCSSPAARPSPRP